MNLHLLFVLHSQREESEVIGKHQHECTSRQTSIHQRQDECVLYSIAA